MRVYVFPVVDHAGKTEPDPRHVVEMDHIPPPGTVLQLADVREMWRVDEAVYVVHQNQLVRVDLYCEPM